MQRICKFFSVLALLSASLSVFAAPTRIDSVSYSNQQTSRLSFELSSAAHHRFFTLNNPSRLVVDFDNTQLQQAIAAPPVDHPLFANIRSAARNNGDLRVVVELKVDADAKSVVVNKGAGTSLQLDVVAKAPVLAAKPVKQAAVPAILSSKKDKVTEAVAVAVKSVNASAATVNKAKGRDIVVAIDAGHGGKDVGAQGNNGTQEKDVVFAIAKRLEGLVNHQPGMRAVMIRKGDYFVKLRDRVAIARAAKADLFVSIHADAFSDASAHGASVYTLSNKGASSASARFLADSENASDAIGGGNLDEKDETLASVLMDLSQSAAKEASQNVGSKVLKNVKSVGHLHREAVQKAGFVVLKSADIPSILVETAFISNPEEERRLATRAYQDKMASAVFGGIMAHFRQYAPANTLMAQLSKSGKSQRLAAVREEVEPVASDKLMVARNDEDAASPVSAKSQHVINRGETLSGIAQQYGISMRALRTANAMNDGNVRVGQVLQIPRNS